jgi:hypothetical protein
MAGRARFHRADELHLEIPAGLAWQAPENTAGRDAVLKRIESDVRDTCAAPIAAAAIFRGE